MHLKTQAAHLAFSAFAVYYVLEISLLLPQMLGDTEAEICCSHWSVSLHRSSFS